MPRERAPEFSLHSPLASALAVLRGVLLSPRSFYRDFEAEGPLKEPALFVLLVGSLTGFLGAVVALLSNLLFGELGAGELRSAVLEGLLFALLSPVCVGIAAGFYLLALKSFVGKAGSFEEVYRIAAYAFGALVLFWIPVVGAFAVTYAFMVLMGIGIHSVYRTSLITTVVVALTGFVPVATALIFVTTLG
ncbi:MAG: YIP1 family protein [Actinomycetota bacterium]|nr:YIP1 family protein [Actinomycetota bacterium]